MVRSGINSFTTLMLVTAWIFYSGSADSAGVASRGPARPVETVRPNGFDSSRPDPLKPGERNGHRPFDGQSPDNLKNDPLKKFRDEFKRNQEVKEAARASGYQIDVHGRNDSKIFDRLDPEETAALRDYISKEPSLARLQMENWRLREPPELQAIYQAISILRAPIPDAELAFFLDPAAFRSPRADMREAWGERPDPLNLPPSGSDLAPFFKAVHGKTVMLVGHIEGTNFVMRDAAHEIAGSHSIRDLTAAARVEEVTLVPIGCKSADAGAPIGFIENISTDQVQIFLKELPVDLAAGDVVYAMSKIGTLQVDMLSIRDVFEVAAVEPGKNQPSIRVSIPRARSYPNLGNANSLQNYNQFEDSIEAAADQLRPWWGRGRFGKVLVSALDSISQGWSILYGLGFASLGYVLQMKSRDRGNFTDVKLRKFKIYKNGAYALYFLALSFIIHGIIVTDTVSILILFAMMVGTFYLNKWNKGKLGRE